MFLCLAELSREIIAGAMHSMHKNEKKIQVKKEISVHFYYFKRYFFLRISQSLTDIFIRDFRFMKRAHICGAHFLRNLTGGEGAK